MFTSNKNTLDKSYSTVVRFVLVTVMALSLVFVFGQSVSAGPAEDAQRAAEEDCQTRFPTNNFDNEGYKDCIAAIDFETVNLEISELTIKSTDTVENVKTNPIYELLLMFLNFLTAGVGLAVTTLIVVGGIQYMTAGGNPQKTQAAIMRISNALIGLVLYLLMFAILQWLIPGGLFG